MVVQRNTFIAKLLLAVFVLQLVFPLLLVLSISTVRLMQEISLESNTTSFQTIILSATQFQQMKVQDNDEITYQDIRYDVKSIRIVGDEYIIQALKDTRETLLQKCNEKQLSKTSKSNQLVVKTFSFPLVFCETLDRFIHIHPYTSLTDFNTTQKGSILFSYSNVLSPPPDIVSV